MKKLLSLFAATGLVASTSATVVACTNPEEPTGPVDKRKELSEDIAVKELGALRELSEEIIIEAIYEKNTIDLGFEAHIEFIGELGQTSTVLRAKENSSYWKGEVTVTYTVNKNFKIQEEDEFDKYNTYHLKKNEIQTIATGQLNIEYENGDEIKYEISDEDNWWVNIEVENNIEGILTLNFTADIYEMAHLIDLTFYSKNYNNLEVIIEIPEKEY